MYLYLVERLDEADYEECIAIVVRARSEGDAINLVTGGGHFGMKDPLGLKVTLLPQRGDREVILVSGRGA